MLVKYEKKGERCLTPCIANHSQKIGSATCCECKHFKGAKVIDGDHFIVCDWLESVLEKVARNHPDTYMKYVTPKMLEEAK